MKNRFLLTLLTALPILSVQNLYAQKPIAETEVKNNAEFGPKLDYTYRQATHPDSIINLQSALFVLSGDKLTTLKGNEIVTLGKPIVDAAMYPLTGAVSVIKYGKKNNSAAIYKSYEMNDLTARYDDGRLGSPLALTYTPEGQNLLVATPLCVRVLDPRKFKQGENHSIALPFTDARHLLMSGNMYYLAVANPTRVEVFNYENRNRRAGWDFETRVNSMVFDSESNQFAVATEDGVTVYDTRTFLPKHTFDDLENALSVAFNSDGKYVAVLESPEKITVINLLKPADRHVINLEDGGASMLIMVPDEISGSLLAYNGDKIVHAKRLPFLKPYYGKLVNDETNERLNEWMKMMPGETMEEYSARVNDDSRARQRKMFEDEIATKFAPDLLSMASVTLGAYDRANQVLEMDFDNMPSIFLPIPESDLADFNRDSEFTFNNARYGVTDSDEFELIYAEVTNSATGKTYIYNNLERTPLNFMSDSDNVVSIELIQQQQMEELKLNELRDRVMAEAKKSNILSDHTTITVDSKLEPDYDADGNKILNYIIDVSYTVDPEFTAVEDFAPGKYHSLQSPAAGAMLSVVKGALEGDFAQYVREGKKLNITIEGTADATPIVSRILYDGAFGTIEDVPYYQQDKIAGMTIPNGMKIEQNYQLAFLRAFGVNHFLRNEIPTINNMKTNTRYNINVSEDKGSEHRRIGVRFVFVDAL